MLYNILSAAPLLAIDAEWLKTSGIQWFNVIVLFCLLYFKLGGMVSKVLTNRGNRIKADIEFAIDSLKQAKKSKSDLQAALDDFDKEKEEILAKAKNIAKERSAKILAAAEEEARHILQKADEEIKAEQKSAADEVKRQIIELSTRTAGRFVQASIDSATQNKYIDEALADWGDKTWQA